MTEILIFTLGVVVGGVGLMLIACIVAGDDDQKS